jgi:MFS family permease
LGSVALALGYVAAGLSGSLWQFILAQGLLIGMLGSSATFSPLVADTSKWFTRRRGIALAICMSGNYLGGAIWPPVMQHFIELVGWRQTYIGIGVFCLLVIAPLALVLRRRPPAFELPTASSVAHATVPLGNPLDQLAMSAGTLQLLLCVAGVACCVAMSMPQVHIVAYCGDLGFGAARGAQMLSLMLGMGIISRLLFGWISDYLGGLRTLLLGSLLQGVALLLFLPFDGLVPLYVVSGLFGLFQGGIVPCYALIAREFFKPAEVGSRVGMVLTATLFGMALGGWMSGVIFDFTGSYKAAFVNGIAFNLLNLSIVGFLLYRMHVWAKSRSNSSIGTGLPNR